jgi:hypothetical protein
MTVDLPQEAKTIQIFLPLGEPRGIRIAEIATRIVQAVAIPRVDLARAKGRPELDHVSVYFLFGETENPAAKPLVYIGQTEDVRKRLDQHHGNKDFWQHAVLIISRTHSFTQAHIRYLEWFCIQRAKEVGRFQVDNGNAGSRPYITEPMEADLRDVFLTLSVLLGTLGYPLFDPIAKPSKASERIYLRGPDAEASGELVEDGFVVHKGALGRVEIVPSALESVTSIRQPLYEAGVIFNENGRIRFTQDHLFRTPSGAAAAVRCRSSSVGTDIKRVGRLEERARSGSRRTPKGRVDR